MSCVCGHAPEEHRKLKYECEGTFRDGDSDDDYPCQCLLYEEGIGDT